MTEEIEKKVRELVHIIFVSTPLNRIEESVVQLILKLLNNAKVK